MQLLVVQPFAYNGQIFQVGDIVGAGFEQIFKDDPSIYGIKVVQCAAAVSTANANIPESP